MVPGPDALFDPVRERLGHGLRQMLAGTSERSDFELDPDAPRFSGPGSATWAVHSDVSMLVGGVRALLFQALHPLAMAGVADHSTYRTDPLGRLQRTGSFIATTTFGTLSEAEQAIKIVRRVHDGVTGFAPDGRPYTANDPNLLMWVHCTEVDSFLAARVRYGESPLSPGEVDTYVAEMAIIAEKLGVIDPPRSRRELRDQLVAFRPELEVGGQARSTVRFLMMPPLPVAARPAYGIIVAAAISLLPRHARRKLWLPVVPLAEPAAIRPAAALLLRTLRWALGPHPARSVASG